MIKPGSIQLLILFAATFVFSLPQVNAQESGHFNDGFRAGASINYGGIYYESNGSALNDVWMNSFGYQVHVLYGYNLSSLISVESGIQFFVHRYNFEEQIPPETDQAGNPTVSFFRRYMDETVGTSYLSVPLNLTIRPLANKSFYAVAGPEIAFKVAYSNGTLITYSELDEVIFFEEPYDIPERSNNTLLLASAGIGYSFESASFPMNIELGVKHSITPYVDGDNFVTSRIRNLSLTISYRL